MVLEALTRASYHSGVERGTEGMAEAKRRLAAILSADVAGYSRLMGDDEAATVETLIKYRTIFNHHISRHDGRLAHRTGRRYR